MEGREAAAARMRGKAERERSLSRVSVTGSEDAALMASNAAGVEERPATRPTQSIDSPVGDMPEISDIKETAASKYLPVLFVALLIVMVLWLL